MLDAGLRTQMIRHTHSTRLNNLTFISQTSLRWALKVQSSLNQRFLKEALILFLPYRVVIGRFGYSLSIIGNISGILFTICFGKYFSSKVKSCLWIFFPSSLMQIVSQPNLLGVIKSFVTLSPI